MGSISQLRNKIRAELEAPAEQRRFGTGWISGVIGLVGALAALGIVICITFPTVFTVPDLHAMYLRIPYRLLLHLVLLISFGFAVIGTEKNGHGIL